MRSQIKELNNKDNKEFIIEISLLLIKPLKKFTISLFISAPVTVLELKEFISRDFDLPIQNMIFFYPLKGIIDNNYVFQFEINKKILLDLILNDRNNDINNKNNEIVLNNYIKYPNTFFFNNILNKQNNINNIINLIKKNNNNYINKIETIHEKSINLDNNKEYYSVINDRNNSFNQDQDNTNIININENINKYESINKYENINNNDLHNINLNLNQMKNSKCSFILTKIDKEQKTFNEPLLGKKRNIPTTFKTTILNKENENIKSKNLLKTQINNNFKVVNFNVNKDLSSINKEIKSQNSK